jgi:hypothetical protein
VTWPPWRGEQTRDDQDRRQRELRSPAQRFGAGRRHNGESDNVFALDQGGPPVAVASHSLQCRQGAIVGSLGLRPDAQVRAKTGFLLLREGLGDSGLAALVLTAYVLPKLAVDAADAAQLPVGVREFLDEDKFVRVRGLVRFLEPAAELGELRGVLGGEQVRFGGSGREFVR